MKSHLLAEGQNKPGSLMDLAEIAAFLDTALAEDGAPDQLRLDVINSAGMLMRELNRRHGWDNPAAVSVPLVLDSVMSESRRLCSCWAAGDYQVLPAFRRWLRAADLLINFAAHSGYCAALDRDEVAKLDGFLYPVGTTRIICDTRGRLLYADASFAEWLGYAARDLYHADLVEDLLAPWFREEANERRQRVKEAGEDFLATLPVPYRIHGSDEIAWVASFRNYAPLTRINDELGRPVAMGVGIKRVPAPSSTRLLLSNRRLARV